MAGIRVTMLVRNTEGLKAKIRARTQRQKQRILATSVREGQATFDLAQAFCPRDTQYMAGHMRLDFTREGFNWTVGFRAEDFVGHVNPVNGVTITAFYPVFQVKGTRFIAGNDFLTAALRLRRAQILAGYRRALAG